MTKLNDVTPFDTANFQASADTLRRIALLLPRVYGEAAAIITLGADQLESVIDIAKSQNTALISVVEMWNEKHGK